MKKSPRLKKIKCKGCGIVKIMPLHKMPGSEAGFITQKVITDFEADGWIYGENKNSLCPDCVLIRVNQNFSETIDFLK